MHHCKGQNVVRPSKYPIQFKNKEVYYEILKELLPEYKTYERYIYGSPALIEHLNNVFDIGKIVNQVEEKNCSLKSPSPGSSPVDDRKSYNSSGSSSCSSQEINKFYPYLYDYLFLFDSSNAYSKEKIFKLTMNSWNCSLVSLILCDVFRGKNYGIRRSNEENMEYKKCLINAKRIVNGYTLEDDLLQYRLIKDRNYLALENLFDVYYKILEYDNSKSSYYRIDHLFHIFFPTIVLLIINQDVKGLKAYTSLLIHKHWIEHVITLFDYALEFYNQIKLDKFPNQIEKLKRKHCCEVKHYKEKLNKFLGGK